MPKDRGAGLKEGDRYDLAKLERRRGNNELAEQHYNMARQIFQHLGALKDFQKCARFWHDTDLNADARLIANSRDAKFRVSTISR